jgi:short-chain fatty acids transporter
LLHGNIRAVTKALEKASGAAWQILVLYTLYAGLSGMIEHTRVGPEIASFLSNASNALTFPTLSAAVGTIFAFFIPSSGGQWALQGLVTVNASRAVGVSVERGLLSMSIGDHMGNLISPFWYVIAAGMLRMDFRTFFGYGLVYAVIWFLVGIAVFTFAPC